MTEQELKSCKKVFVFLNGISRLGLVVFITLPLPMYLFMNQSQTTFVFEILFVISGLLVLLRAWHLYFDAQLFKNLSIENLNLEDIDQIILKLFKKQIKNKNLEDRINACYKMVNTFFILIFVHFVFFFGILFWILGK
jgi:hypothetical protein